MRRLLAILTLWPAIALGAISLDTTACPSGPTSCPVGTSQGASNYTTVTSSSFSTGGTNRLILVGVVGVPAGSVTGSTWSLSGAGLTWTKVKEVRDAGNVGASAIFSAAAPAQLSSVTVTGTMSNAGHLDLVVVPLTAAGALSVGNSNTGSGVSSPASVSVTASGSGSEIVAFGEDTDIAQSRTFTANATAIRNQLDANGWGCTYFAEWLTSATSGAGSVSIGTTAPSPSPNGWSMVGAEVVESVGAAAAPTASPTPATYNAPQTVTLSCASPSPTIRYTTDGSTPSGSSTVYSGPISTGAFPGVNIQAICQSSGLTDSPVTGFYFPIGHPFAATRYWGP